MRYLKLSLLAILTLMGTIGSAYAFTNPPEPTIISEKKGVTGRRMGEQAAVVFLARNSHASPNTVTLASGDAVAYDTNSDDGVTVRHTTTSADGAFAGIAVTAILSSDATSGTTALDDWGRRNWGYVLVHGKVPANSTAGGSNNAQVGDVVITSTDAGMITTIPNRATAAAVTTNGVNGIAANGGFFYDADAQGTTVEVQIDLE